MPVFESCQRERADAKARYQAAVAELEKSTRPRWAKLSDAQEIKDEKYVHKNRLFDAKMQRDKELQEIKDRRHAAFDYKYHLIDMLRLSKFTFYESVDQRWENYKYTFNTRDFLLKTACTSRSSSSSSRCASSRPSSRAACSCSPSTTSSTSCSRLRRACSWRWASPG